MSAARRSHQFAFSWNHDIYEDPDDAKTLQERLNRLHKALITKLKSLPALRAPAECDPYPLTKPGHFGGDPTSNLGAATFTIISRGDYQGFSVAMDALTRVIIADQFWRRDNLGNTRHRVAQRLVGPLLAKGRTRRDEYESGKSVSTWTPNANTSATRRSKDTTITHRFTCGDARIEEEVAKAVRRHLIAAREAALFKTAMSLHIEWFDDEDEEGKFECLAINDASRLVLQWANREVFKFMTTGTYRKDWRPQRDREDPRITWWICRGKGYKRDLVKQNVIRPATAWTDKLSIGRRGRTSVRPQDHDTRSSSAYSVSTSRTGSSSSAARPSGKSQGNAWFGNTMGWLSATISGRQERQSRSVDHSRSRSRSRSPVDRYFKAPGKQRDGRTYV